MAVRFTGTFKSPKTSPVGPDYTHEYIVKIYDANYVGSSYDILLESCKITYDSASGDDLTSPIIGSRAKIGVIVPTSDATITAFVEEFAASAEEQYTIEISTVAGSDVVWRGILVPDFSGEEDIAPNFVFSISSVCGLGLLKKKPYHDGTAIYTGIDRLTKHITRVLSKLSHTDGFWGASDIFIKTAVDWWSVSMSSGAADDPMYQGGVDNAAFYDYATEGNVDKDVLSSYDVLWNILKAFECRIFQIDGYWWIEQLGYRTSSSYYTRHYSKSGGYLSNATNSGVNLINNTIVGAKITTVNYDFLPALERAEVTYDVKLRRNFLAGTVQNSGAFDTLISSNSGAAIMTLRFTINYEVTNDSSPLGAATQYYIIPQVTLKIGDNYLTRDYTITNFTAHVTNLSWETAGTIAMPILLESVPLGTTKQGKVTFDMIVPPLPADGSDNYFGVPAATAEMTKQTGAPVDDTDFTISIDISSRFLEIFDLGTPIVSEDKVLYISENSAVASEIYETTIRLGSAGMPNSAGRIMRWDGSQWNTASYWGQGVDTRDDFLGDLLARNILNARDTIRRRLNGTVYGNFSPKKLLSTTDGKKWMFANVTWDLTQNQWQGIWFELDYGTAGVNSTPIKIKVLPGGGTTIEPAPPSGGISNTAPGFNANPPPTVLAPVAYNGLDGEIDEGDVITSIPIKIASLGNEFLAGDGVTLVNPVTGQYQTFEIATAPAFGATSLSVVSEASSFVFPEDSYLVVKQNAYAFSLPSATQGQILRYNDTTDVWEPYSGTTDGHVLTWDATNGWQSEAAGGGGITALTGDVTASGSGSVAATIANDAVTTAKIANAAVTNAKLGLLSVSTNNIVNAAVDTTKLADNAVTTVKITDANVTTAKIANDAVTLAKLQNAVAANVVLGNIGAAGDPYAELTKTNLYSLLGMTGVTNRIAIWSGTQILNSDVAFGVDAANDRMSILCSNPGIGEGIAAFNIGTSGVLTGAKSLFAFVGSTNGNVLGEFRNKNTGADANTIFQIGQAFGTGDAALQMSITGAGGVTYAVGIDKSDGLKFKITPDAALPGATTNSGLIMTKDVIAKVGINLDAPNYPLDVATQARAKQFMFTNNKPTAGAAGNGLGTGGSIGGISGADNAFTLPFTTGATGLVAGGPICTITYFTQWPTFAVPVFCQNNDDAGNEISKFVFGTIDGAKFELKVRTGQTLTPSKTYILNFVVGGQG